MAQLRREHVHAGESGSRLRALRDDRLRQAQRQSTASTYVTGDAGDTQAIGAVPLDREVEYDVRLVSGPQVLGKRQPELEIAAGAARQIMLTVVWGPALRSLAHLPRPTWIPMAEHEDPGVIVGQSQLATRAEHAVGDDATHPALLYAEITGQHGANGREYDDISDVEVPGTANNLDRLRPTGVDDDPADLVGIGNGGNLQNLRQHDVAQALADRLHTLDDKPERVKVRGERSHLDAIGGPRLERRKFPQPRQWNTHLFVS
jgi:hypothetical protein